MDRVVPKLEVAESRLWWDATPHRAISEGPFALRLTLGVRGPTRFHHLHQDSLTALRTDFGSLLRVAMMNLAPMQAIQIEGGPVKIGGYKGVGAAEQLLLPSQMMELHRLLVSPTLRVVVVGETVLGAVGAGAGVSDGELISRSAAMHDWGTVTLSGGVHLVENGQLVRSMAPR